MLIFSAFKTLTNQVVTVELKNDVAVTGTLKSVDQFLNFRIDNMKVVEGDEARWPHLVSSKGGFREVFLSYPPLLYQCHRRPSSLHSSVGQSFGTSISQHRQ